MSPLPLRTSPSHFFHRTTLLALVLSAALLGGALTACSSPGTPTTGEGGSGNGKPAACLSPKAPFVLAAGLRSNSPKPKLPDGTSRMMAESTRAGLKATLIRVDGDPKVVFDQSFTSDAKNDEAKKADHAAFLGRLRAAMSTNLKASAPEADVLGALTLAARSVPPGGNVILVDSGLQTSPGLDFRENGMLDADPAEVVAYLRKARLMPDLSGRRVLLSGIGYTAPPQPKLDTRLRDNLVAIWERIARDAGASCVAKDTSPNTGDAPAALPPVAQVTPPPHTVTFRPCGTTTLGEKDDVGFRQGTADYRDPAAAERTLERLAGVLRGGRQRIHLVGATSSEGDEAANLRLSRDRAARVRETLVKRGVAADRITVEGKGEHLPGRVPDLGPNGELLPGPAARNRVVVVQLTCPSGS